MCRAVANTLWPAARPASTIARPRPRELPVTNHTCAIHPPLSRHPRIFWRSFSNSGLDAQERKRNRSQQVRQTDVAVHFGANTICYSVYDLRTILCGINVHSEQTLAEGQVHHPDDSFGDIGHISIGGGGSSETLHDVLPKMRVRGVVVLGLTRLVCWCTSMGEVIRAGGEGSGNDDRGLDAPAIQLCGVADSECIHSCLRRKVG